MSKEFNYIDGITIATCRRICRYAFGKERLFKVEKNFQEYTYDIYLRKLVQNDEVDKDTLEYFQEFWGNRWRVFIVPIPNNNDQQELIQENLQQQG